MALILKGRGEHCGCKRKFEKEGPWEREGAVLSGHFVRRDFNVDLEVGMGMGRDMICLIRNDSSFY